MKPYGRNKNLKGRTWKTDCHPKKGYVNWWECIIDCSKRGSINKSVKKDIKNQIDEII